MANFDQSLLARHLKDIRSCAFLRHIFNYYMVGFCILFSGFAQNLSASPQHEIQNYRINSST